MHKFILTFLLTVAAIPALAGNWTGQRIGQFDYWNNSNGASYTGQQIGQFYYWNGHDQYGNYHSGTGQRIGQFYFWNDND